MQWSLSWNIIYCVFLGRVWKAIGWCGKLHGWHDILWGYPLEKKVSRIVNISSNQLTKEITYTNCYVKLCFTIVQKVMHLNHDGLFLDQKTLKKMHKYFQLPMDVHCGMGENCTFCEPWHQDCVMVVPYQEITLMVWKLVHWLPPYYCKHAIIMKGIVVRRRKAFPMIMS